MTAETGGGTHTRGIGAEAGGEGWILPLLRRHAMIIAAVVILLAFALTADAFGSLGNAENIVKQAAPVLLLGLGMAMVVLVGGIDLSVGSVVLASATVGGALLTVGAGPVAAIAGGIAIGAAVGLVNALLIEGLRISPVIVTLGTMIAVRGLALVLLARFNSWITIDHPAFDTLTRATLLSLPLSVVLTLALAALLWLVLRGTILGRRLHAVGDNAAAARLCGVSVARVRGVAYVGCGAFAGAAGLLTGARTGIVSPSIGLGLEFFAIAVVALGAGGLPAGRVRVGQAMTGALILMAVFNYMTIRGVPGTWQTTATGVLLLAAVIAGRLLQGRAEAEAGFEGEAGAAARGWSAALARHAVAVAAILLAILFAIVNPRFATLANLVALIEQNAVLAIVAIGAMLGIVSRCIDIAPGSVVALGTVVAALALQAGIGPVPALACGLAACLAVYALNGVIVGRLGIDPLIVTLAAWIWARGLAVSLTDAQTLPFDGGFVAAMNVPLLFGLTPPVLLVLAAFLLGWLILARTPIGIRIFALGGDPRMLRQSGVDDGTTRLRTLLLMGLFTALAMPVMLGRLGAAAPTAGFGLELDAIVAVVIGGASFRGGEGRLRDTALGVAFLAILNNGLSGLQMTDATFFLAKGGAILLALTLQGAVRRLDLDRRSVPA